MTRTIKFRVFNKNAKDFIRGNKKEVVHFDLILWAQYAAVNRLENLDNYIAQLFTGLLDMEDNEIYEGHILNGGHIVEYFTNLNWDGGGSSHAGFYCRTWFNYSETEELDYYQGFDNVEIIGNIFENPEMARKNIG